MLQIILLSSAIFLTAATSVLAGEGTSETIEVRRLARVIPFPAACLAAAGREISVDVGYEVGRDLQAKRIRVLRSDDSCFDEAAVASVRTDLFLNTGGGNGSGPNGVYTHRIDFRPIDPSMSPAGVEADRSPPLYPPRCFKNAAQIEIVVSALDISEEGVPENIRAIDATNPCLIEAAHSAIGKWRYRLPKGAEGTLRRVGLVTETTFELVDSGSKPDLRVAFKKQSGAIERMIRSKSDAGATLAAVNALEAQLGDGFSRDEVKAFYRLRAAARLEFQDWMGALDDLGRAQRAGTYYSNYQAIADLTQKLKSLAPGVDLSSGAAGDITWLEAPGPSAN